MPITDRTIDLTNDEKSLLQAMMDSGHDKDALALKGVLQNIPDKAGRMYTISRALNTNPELAKLKDHDFFKQVNKNFWDYSNEENYTPPDIEKAKAEGLFDKESPYHWMKRTPEELKQISEKAGYESLQGGLDAMREIETRKERERMFDGPVGTALELLYPRTTETIKRGGDWDWADPTLDVLEQGVYAINPVGRSVEAGLAQATRNGSKLAKTLGAGGAFIANNAANPFMMETVDALAYNGRNTPRANFNLADALMGTGINVGMGETVKRVGRKLNNGEVKVNSRDFKEKETLKSLENKWEQQDISRKIAENEKEISNMQNELDKRWAKGFDTSDLQAMIWNLKNENLALESKIKPTPTETKLVRNENIKELLPYDFVDFVSNKTGDAVSENPQYTKRVLRTGIRGVPMVGPAISNLADLYYESKNKEDRRKKLDDALKASALLGSNY